MRRSPLFEAVMDGIDDDMGVDVELRNRTNLAKAPG
jgi:hypothetical protein